ncbi:acetolactate synthase catalytic subunit [Ephemerocybe angulata]|uniref:Acetolactate synthase catalytic subunit n=1 Tax=Ephemerocybe angulata TaxID=980116 RepID=A0A8H6IFI6_9AGAR|nr:acetolactate synthase catalytic subunit [Tulosesus angulatus]
MATPTASSVFLKTLVNSGITHAFVNWGSDHPALLADLDRQRSSGGSGTSTKPTIITCPNEMVALSAAQGYAQVTGKPALVIVHVDVGTQALAGAVHNVDRNRCPVIIYAGASPFSTEGEHKGSRNEWIMWLQDVPDQPSIVRQYMRHTSQLHSALTIPGMVRRAVQIANSEPKGPVYLWARREVMEQEMDTQLFKDVNTAISQEIWPTIEPAALSATAASRIASALLTAQHPLIITSHLGRNPHAVSSLLALSTLLAIPILPVCPSVVSVPHSHPFGLAPTFLTSQPKSNSTSLDNAPESPGAAQNLSHIAKADVILVVDSDLGWIPGNDQRPANGARVFVLDGGDPLKTTVEMGWWRGEAEMICHADAEVSLGQILDAIREVDVAGIVADGEDVKRRARTLRHAWERRIKELDTLELDYAGGSIVGEGYTTYTVPNIMGALREGIRRLTPGGGQRTLILNETITNFQIVWEHMRPDVPGNMMSSGGSSLGWALAAAVGASLGGIVANQGTPLNSSSLVDGANVSKFDLVVAIVGDGSFLFGIPSSVYWMARRYNTPFLTIVLNNGGRRAPKLSMLSMHPVGVNNSLLATVPADTLTTGFGPVSPDYSQIAVAASAGWAWGKKVGGKSKVAEANMDGSTTGVNIAEAEETDKLGDGGKAALDSAVAEGIRMVLEERRCAVLDCVLDGI